jgi:uncharacterized membrane protein (Fun14 family)
VPSFVEDLVRGGDGLRNDPARRRMMRNLSALLFAVCGVFVALGFAIGWSIARPFAIAAALIGAIPLAMLGLSRTSITLDPLQELRRERTQLKGQLRPGASATDVRAVVLLSLNQMEEFYVLTIRQARASFWASVAWASVAASALGLATVLGGIWLFYLRPDPNVTLTAISTLAGVITQFVGVTYFVLHKRASDRMGEFFERLQGTQDTMIAVSLVDEMEDGDERSHARRDIIRALMRQRASGSRSVPVADAHGEPALEPVPATR